MSAVNGLIGSLGEIGTNEEGSYAHGPLYTHVRDAASQGAPKVLGRSHVVVTGPNGCDVARTPKLAHATHGQSPAEKSYALCSIRSSIGREKFVRNGATCRLPDGHRHRD